MSSDYTESYESILGMSSSTLYLDEKRSQVYWIPECIYETIDKDMVEVISGVNLPMLLKAFTMRMDSSNTLDQIAKESAAAGRNSIKVAGELLNTK